MLTFTVTYMSNTEFNHKLFPESSFESGFTYMDSGLNYFQYPPSPIGVECEYLFESRCLRSLSDSAPTSRPLDGLLRIELHQQLRVRLIELCPSPPNTSTS